MGEDLGGPKSSARTKPSNVPVLLRFETGSTKRFMSDQLEIMTSSCIKAFRNVVHHSKYDFMFHTQLHAELDELHKQLRARHGNYGSSLSSVKMISQAFRQFEKSVQLIEGKVKNFSNTADTMIRNRHHDSRRIRHEVDEIERKWNEFHNSISEYHLALDDSSKFFEQTEKVGRLIEIAKFCQLIVIKYAMVS